VEQQARVLKPKDIGVMLNLSTGRVYQLVRAETWGKPIQIGKSIFISRDRFEAWLNGQESGHAKQ
jgi:phosphoribosyl-AMP cyclohydrolase